MKYSQATINKAINMIREAARNTDTYQFNNPAAVAPFVELIIEKAGNHREHFVVIYLDTQNKLITDEILFSGTINAASVYPREVAKHALMHNAASVIIAHNHPSGNPEPSVADQRLTNKIREGLQLFDINVLDHVIVGHGGASYSFADNGLL